MTCTYEVRVHSFAPFQSHDLLKPAVRFVRPVLVMTEDGLGEMEAHGLQIVPKLFRRLSRIRKSHV